MKCVWVLAVGGVSLLSLMAPAKADDAMAGQPLHFSGGNDRMRVEVAPNYSEELGFSMKGAAGSYLTDSTALGLIVEYGKNRREYLANAGI